MQSTDIPVDELRAPLEWPLFWRQGEADPAAGDDEDWAEAAAAEPGSWRRRPQAARFASAALADPAAWKPRAERWATLLPEILEDGDAADAAIAAGIFRCYGVAGLAEIEAALLERARGAKVHDEGRRITLGFLEAALGNATVTTWTGGTVPKKVKPGEVMPWDTAKFARYLAAAVRDSGGRVEPGFQAFVEAFPREAVLGRCSFPALLLATRARQVVMGEAIETAPAALGALILHRRGAGTWSRTGLPTEQPEASGWVLDPEQKRRLAGMLARGELRTWERKWGIHGLPGEMAPRVRNALLAAVAFGPDVVRGHLVLASVALQDALAAFKKLDSDRCWYAAGAFSYQALIRGALPLGELSPGTWVEPEAWLDAFAAYQGPVNEADDRTAAYAGLAVRGTLGAGGTSDGRVVALAAAIEAKDPGCAARFAELVRTKPATPDLAWRDLVWLGHAALVRGCGLPAHQVLDRLVAAARE